MGQQVTMDDCVEAFAVASRYIVAMRDGDWATAGSLLYGPSLRVQGLPLGNPALAGEMARQAWGGTDDELRLLAPSTSVRVIEEPGDPDTLIGVGFVEATLGEVMQGFAEVVGPRPARTVALIKSDGRWWMWGSPTEEQWQAARLVAIAGDR